MKAIIYNSGLGNRMGDFTLTHHKSMARLLNGETIFARQLRLLRNCGIRDFLVTTGPFKEQLEQTAAAPDFAGLRFTFVENPAYQTTNYIYSMYLARQHFNDDVLLLHGDLVFSQDLVEALLRDPRPNLGCVDRHRPLPEKDFKARLAGERIEEVSVSIFSADCCAFQPLYKLSRQTLGAWARQVEAFIARGEDRVYAENALNQIPAQLDIRAFPYGDYYIDEVDNLDDLSRVSRQIQAYEIERQPTLCGDEAYLALPDFLARRGAKRPMLVCGGSLDRLPIRDFLLDLAPVRFSGFSPNPTYEQAVQGTELFRREGCDALIAVGGGSTLDTAKNIKLFSRLDPGRHYLEQPPQFSPVPLVALPTTAGTGSEATRFSVLYNRGVKHSLAQDCLLPDLALLMPALLRTLPDYQRRCTALDALCQCVESIWSVRSNEQARAHARLGIRLLLDHLTPYLAGEEGAAAAMLRGANEGGRAINLTQTTAAHAMSYKLGTLYGLPHGYAVALCLGPVWVYMLEQQPWPQPLAEAFQCLAEAFGVAGPDQALQAFQDLLQTLGLSAPALREPGDLELLAASVNPQRLSNNPLPLSHEGLLALYRQILCGA